jgi:hypothetical protein
VLKEPDGRSGPGGAISARKQGMKHILSIDELGIHARFASALTSLANTEKSKYMSELSVKGRENTEICQIQRCQYLSFSIARVLHVHFLA